MKIFLALLYPVFIFAMGTGIYMAYKSDEGLVDENYFEKGKNFFHAREMEEQLGIVITEPAPLVRGGNGVNISVTSHGAPLEHAAVTLFIGNVSTTVHDRTFRMREIAPGTYQAPAEIPLKGTWLMRIELQKNNLTTGRKWFFDVN